MTSKSEKDRAKQIQDRCQNILLQMLKDEDNKYCVDCDAKGPRWASWNLGIFLCIRCAGIHRNLGVHISKVKSVNLDSWTPEQVVSLQQMGNSRARAVYEANLPDSFRRPQNDSSLEAFIRAKYEQKKYIAKEWVPPAKPKVNWDKEIDEEIEKQKRKKKSTSSSGVGPLPAPSVSDKKYNRSDVIPSIPKPKSSVSPKLGRNTPPTAVEAKPNGAADLLGLDTTKTEPKSNEDIFSSFFSAPQEIPVEPPKEIKPDLKAEEENFFKQSAPTEKEKSKLTMDSILALYSQSPSTNFQATSTNFQAPSTNFQTPSTNFQTPSTNFQTPTTNFQTQSTNLTSQFNPVQSGFNQFGSFQQQSYSNIPQSQQGFSNVPQGQQAFSNVPQSQQGFSNVPQSQQAFSNVPQSQQGFSNVPQSQQGFSNVPQSQQGFSNVPQSQQAFSNVPQSQQAFSNVPQSQQGFSNVPQQNGMQFNQFQGNQFQQFGLPPQQGLQQQNLQQNLFNQQPQSVTQQLGSLSLGQSFPNAFAQNNVSNTWQ